MNTSGNWPLGEVWARLLELDAKFFPHPWKPEQWASLDRSQHRLFLWEHGDKVMGFALFAHLSGDDTAHLLKICLEPSLRGSGEAMKFWSHIRSELSGLKIFLEVEEGNLAARSFYKKVGFTILRTVRAYYSNGENGVMMLLVL